MLDSLRLSIPALEMSSVFKSAVADLNIEGVSAALKDYAAISANIPDITLSTKALLGITDTLNMLPTTRISSMAEAIIPLVDTSALEVLKDSATLAAIAAAPKIDWSWISEVYSDGDDSDEDSECTDVEVTPEIPAEIAADINEVLSCPNEAGDISQSKYVKWKEQHPFLADLYMQVLLPLIQAILYGLIAFGAATLIASANKDARVYEEPTSTSNIVNNISVEQNVTIIGDVPYFYEVEFVDPETGETVTGYIYKGNLIINDQEELTTKPEETEDVTEMTEFIGEMSEKVGKLSE
jgi:hypothetical protein